MLMHPVLPQADRKQKTEAKTCLRTDVDVRRFYANRGRQMFEERMYTAPIRRFLEEEEVIVERVMSALGRNHLVEVGCGSGRYLHQAVRSGFRYDGIDLVDDLVREGRQRWKLLMTRGARLHVGSVVDIDRLYANLGLAKCRTILLFPFNCFGNLACVERGVRALARTRAPVLLSTFGLSKCATEIRADYYRHLGCQGVSWATVPEVGTVVRSQDGLVSFAYRLQFLIDAFANHGFGLSAVEGLAGIGRLATFCPLPRG